MARSYALRAITTEPPIGLKNIHYCIDFITFLHRPIYSFEAFSLSADTSHLKARPRSGNISLEGLPPKQRLTYREPDDGSLPDARHKAKPQLDSQLGLNALELRHCFAKINILAPICLSAHRNEPETIRENTKLYPSGASTTKTPRIKSIVFNMVRVEGLEPPRLAAPEPKSGASANFATPASER